MRIETGVCCVDYEDFLRLTLPNNMGRLGCLTVVTSPRDEQTIRLAQEAGADLLVTDAWYRDGPFSKARALNEWICSVGPVDADRWLLAVDADIVLPPGLSLALAHLDTRGLYGARRRTCTSEAAWNEFVDQRRSFESFPIDIPPVKNGRVWGSRPTSNPAALCAYFQLWNPMCSVGMKQFPRSPTAADYDVEFALSFPEHQRSFLSDYEVLHLGPSKANWGGRKSARWQVAVPLRHNGERPWKQGRERA